MKDYIASRCDTFVNDLKTIVNQDSSSGNSEGIAQVARFFEARFSKLGMACEISFEGEGKVPCFKAESLPGKTPYDLMCLGHMDTVFPEGEAAIRPFTQDGKRGYGPGVCDMKGGLLVVLHAMEALHHQGLLDKLSVCVAFNGDEETGSDNSRPWIEANAAQSRRVMVFEPCRPGYNMVRRRKGGGWFHVTARGCSAHAGADPEKGVNAVVELAHQITRINTLNDPVKGTSAQVTVVRGGDKVNIIPDEARASVDVRISKIEARETVENFFKELSATPHLPGAIIEISGGIDRPPMETGPGADALFDEIRACAEKLGITPGGISTGGCSDGNFTAAGGTPTVDGMGLVGANSHREDEYVELESITPMVSLLAGICHSLLPK
ncbi:MAG: M20 family metallopeptidase [Desulfobacter sp.]|nr:MAG: M20 family metallopeptidase [Desulfobacter sp.]